MTSFSEEALTLDDLPPLTIQGRMAYGLCLVEQAVLKQDIRLPAIRQALDDLWGSVSSEFMSDWYESLKSKNRGEDTYAILSHIEVLDYGGNPQWKLPDASPLLGIDIRILQMIDAAHSIVEEYMYGAVEPGAPECIACVNKILDLGRDFDLRLPPASLFRNYVKRSEAENHVWGDTFSPEPFRVWLWQEFG